MSSKRIENYIFLEKLSDSESGEIYSCLHEIYNKIYAVKCLSANGMTKEDLEHLKSVLQNFSRLDNPNVISFKNYKRTKNNHYIFMEYCNGGDLKKYIKDYFNEYKQPLNEFYIQKIIKQIVPGMDYLHSKNIIHRDIKLENILINFDSYPNIVINGVLPDKLTFQEKSLNQSFTIKISDLDYSKKLKENLTETVVGNFAPDMMKKSYNSSIDLWSLGVITYELLTNTSPFIGKTEKETIENIKKGMYSLPNNLKCSLEIISFINGLLQYYPEKRLNWAQIKSHPFLNRDVKYFKFIDMKKLSDSEKDQIEFDSKESDNLLWILYKCDNLNMKLDKINENEIKKDEVKKMLEKSIVINQAVKNASEEEEIQQKKEKQKIEDMQKKMREEIQNEEIENKNVQQRQEKLNNEENDIKKEIEKRKKSSDDNESLEMQLEKNKKEKEALNNELENKKKNILQKKKLFEFTQNLLNKIDLNQKIKEENKKFESEIEHLRKQLEEEKAKNTNKEKSTQEAENKEEKIENEIKEVEKKINNNNNNLNNYNFIKRTTQIHCQDITETEVDSDEEDDGEFDFEDYLNEKKYEFIDDYIEKKFKKY
jgi:serine/threonine protein kinase